MIRTGPNPKRRIRTAGGRSTGRAAAAPSAKKAKSRMPQHTAQWWEHEAKKRPLVRCGSCGAFFLKGHWTFVPAGAQRGLQQQARAATCPSCAAEKRGRAPDAAAGELTIRGLATAARPQALQTIAGFAARARDRNPEARVLSVDASRAAIVVRTTQNQLAVRLGKTLDRSMKGGALRITYSEDDLPLRVTWTAPKR